MHPPNDGEMPAVTPCSFTLRQLPFRNTNATFLQASGVATHPVCSLQQRTAFAAPHDSPGLDDFAHMGLITELLE